MDGMICSKLINMKFNMSVQFIEYDCKTGVLLNVVGLSLWFWAE